MELRAVEVRTLELIPSGFTVAPRRADFCWFLEGHEPPADRARVVDASLAAAAAVHQSQRASADGGDWLQHAVPVVHRPESGRADLVPTTFSRNRNSAATLDVGSAIFNAAVQPRGTGVRRAF